MLEEERAKLNGERDELLKQLTDSKAAIEVKENQIQQATQQFEQFKVGYFLFLGWFCVPERKKRISSFQALSVRSNKYFLYIYIWNSCKYNCS